MIVGDEALLCISAASLFVCYSKRRLMICEKDILKKIFAFFDLNFFLKQTMPFSKSAQKKYFL